MSTTAAAGTRQDAGDLKIAFAVIGALVVVLGGLFFITPHQPTANPMDTSHVTGQVPVVAPGLGVSSLDGQPQWASILY